MTDRFNARNTFPIARGAPEHTSDPAAEVGEFLPEIHQWLGDVKGVAESFGDGGGNIPHGATPFFISTIRRSVPTGPLTETVILNTGSGYTSAPTLSVVDGGQSARIRFTTRSDDGGFHGEMHEAIIINGGRNYSSNTTITIPAPDQTVGETNPPTRRVQATATATIVRGQITAITFTERGAGYNPTAGTTYDAVITDPGTGSGATATCTIDAGVVIGGRFTNSPAQANLTRYTSVPTITISGGGGSGCVMRAIVEDGYLVGLVVVSRGTGYTSAPTITISGGGVTSGHPSVEAVIRQGIINSVSITNGGMNYNAPRINISPPTGQTTTTAVILALAITRGDIATNQLRIGSTGDDGVLFTRLAPTPTENPELYSKSIGDGEVKAYLNINLDTNLANVYFYDLIQRTNDFDIVLTLTGETRSDGTPGFTSKIEGFVPTAQISVEDIVEEKVRENEAPGLDIAALSEKIESVRSSIQSVAISAMPDIPVTPDPSTPDPSTPDPGTPDPGTPDPSVPTPEPMVELPPVISADVEQIQANSVVEAFGNEVASEVTTTQIDHSISEALGEEYTSSERVDFEEVAIETPDIIPGPRGTAIDLSRGRQGGAAGAIAGGALVAGGSALAVGGATTTVVSGGAIVGTTLFGVAGGGTAVVAGTGAVSVFGAGTTVSVVAGGTAVVATAPVSVPIIIGAAVVGAAVAGAAYFFSRRDDDDGTTDPLDVPGARGYDSLGMGVPGPRPGTEPPRRGGEVGEDGAGGASSPARSGPSGAGVRGSQGNSITVSRTIPVAIAIPAPRNMLVGQSVEVYFRHFAQNVRPEHAPNITFDRRVFRLADNVSGYRNGDASRNGRGLIQNLNLETGNANVYSINNEIVGIRITKIGDDQHLVESLGIWPNKATI